MFFLFWTLPLGLAVGTKPLPGAAIAALRTTGFAVVPEFLSPSAVLAVKSDISALRGGGRFASAGVGDASTNRLDASVRQCEQCFLYPQLKHGGGGDQAGRSVLYDSLGALAAELQRDGGPALDALLTEGLYARYPGGGYYRRHVDSVAGTASEIRQWSYLLYLNEQWQPGDGGEVWQPRIRSASWK